MSTLKKDVGNLKKGSRSRYSISERQIQLMRIAFNRPQWALEGQKQQESLFLELGDKKGLIYNYFAQWLILTGLYRPEEAMVMLDKEESLLQESGKKKRLGRKLRKAIVHSANVGAVLREPGVPEETRIAVSGAGR